MYRNNTSRCLRCGGGMYNAPRGNLCVICSGRATQDEVDSGLCPGEVDTKGLLDPTIKVTGTTENSSLRLGNGEAEAGV